MREWRRSLAASWGKSPGRLPVWQVNRSRCILAPRAGLEPATSRLQGPRSFDWAWTISSPAWMRVGCRALARPYWIGSSAS